MYKAVFIYFFINVGYHLKMSELSWLSSSYSDIVLAFDILHLTPEYDCQSWIYDFDTLHLTLNLASLLRFYRFYI